MLWLTIVSASDTTDTTYGWLCLANAEYWEYPDECPPDAEYSCTAPCQLIEDWKLANL